MGLRCQHELERGLAIGKRIFNIKHTGISGQLLLDLVRKRLHLLEALATDLDVDGITDSADFGAIAQTLSARNLADQSSPFCDQLPAGDRGFPLFGRCYLKHDSPFVRVRTTTAATGTGQNILYHGFASATLLARLPVFVLQLQRRIEHVLHMPVGQFERRSCWHD